MKMLIRLLGRSHPAIEPNLHILKPERVCLGVREAVFLLVRESLELGGRDEIGDRPNVTREIMAVVVMHHSTDIFP